MPVPDARRTRAFKTPAEFARWLKKYHASETELWLKIYKKGSGLKTISWREAVIEALCWGWIDSVKKSLDDQAYLQRFTPRRKASGWSKVNTEHVERLIAEGRMQESGLQHVRAAKADGRWQLAYAPASEMTMPEDFLAAIERHAGAREFYSTLSKTTLYSMAYRLRTVKRAETRQRYFDKFLSMLQNGERPC